jgi:hypothetical protein
VPCPGGAIPDEKLGKHAIKALSWKAVEEISARFLQLNPYDRNAVSKSVLKIEKEKFDRETGKQRQLYCFAISEPQGLDAQ